MALHNKRQDPRAIDVKSLIVLAHSGPTSTQMAALAARVLAEGGGHTAEISDLYRLGFDPVERAEHFADRHDPDRFDPQIEPVLMRLSVASKPSSQSDGQHGHLSKGLAA